MHGHEVDPLIPSDFSTLGPWLWSFVDVLSFKSKTCIVTNDALSDIFLEIGEQFLRIFHRLTKKIRTAVSQSEAVPTIRQIKAFQRQIRTTKMLNRYYHDKTQDLYDVAIVGHTHKPGHFDEWYFNSGSWTGKTNNFLKIYPDGEVEIFDWDTNGAKLNQPAMLN